MPIKNTTKKTLLSSTIRTLKTTLGKGKGLMFSSPLKDKGVIFLFKKEQRIDLHMLFVFFPIDILWLNSEKKVVGMKENARPFCFFIKSPAKARYVIELPAGTIKKTKTENGDRIFF